MKIIERETFHVCGYAAQTTAEQNDADLSALYDDFFESDKDSIETWTEFFYTDIPGGGYGVNAPLNFYFEYYPDSVNGNYELWAPVVKSNV